MPVISEHFLSPVCLTLQSVSDCLRLRDRSSVVATLLFIIGSSLPESPRIYFKHLINESQHGN